MTVGVAPLHNAENPYYFDILEKALNTLE